MSLVPRFCPRQPTVLASLTDQEVDATDLTTYTFSTKSFGTATSDRIVVVGIAARSSTGSITISSVTIGGVSATVRASAINAGSGTEFASIYTASVPTGVTGDVVIVFSGGMQRCAVMIYRMVGASSAVPNDSQTDTTLTGQVLSVSMNCPANGVIIGAGFSASGGTAASTWTGITEDADAALETAANNYTSASLAFVAQQTGLTVSATFDASVARACLATASWGP